jgi:CheY-like chemotaxis protein
MFADSVYRLRRRPGWRCSAPRGAGFKLPTTYTALSLIYAHQTHQFPRLARIGAPPQPASGRRALHTGNFSSYKLILDMKSKLFGRLFCEKSTTVASFGSASLICHREGRWELRGGSHGEHAAAREWCSLFQHEATFPSAPFPAIVPRPGNSNRVQNHILIADDDSLVRGSLAAVLECEGYMVDEARNGIEAVSRAIEHSPDLVLLDLNMPHWDGWTAFTQLDRVTPLLPVIVITARPNQYEKAVRLGVDAFMEKPLNFPVLVSAIHRLTGEDEGRHVRRITHRGFVTQLLSSANA